VRHDASDLFSRSDEGEIRVNEETPRSEPDRLKDDTSQRVETKLQANEPGASTKDAPPIEVGHGPLVELVSDVVDNKIAVSESSRDEAERFRRLAEDARVVGDQHREALEAVRQERELLRQNAEDARTAAEDARHAAEEARHAVVESVRATADSLAATLEQMRALEEMRKTLREIRDLNTRDVN
jgi:colicin import membrane protein